MDIKTLTLGEVSKIEELSGLPLSALAEDDKPKGKLLAALALVIKRREDPKFTYEMASQMTTQDVMTLIDSDEVDEAEKK